LNEVLGKWSLNTASHVLGLNVENFGGVAIQAAYQVLDRRGIYNWTPISIKGDCFMNRVVVMENNSFKEDSSAICMTIGDIIVGNKHERDVVIKFE
jgi:hypothetical protein